VFYECYVSCVIWVCLKHVECRDNVWVSQVVECGFLVGLFRLTRICGLSSPLVGWGDSRVNVKVTNKCMHILSSSVALV